MHALAGCAAQSRGGSNIITAAPHYRPIASRIIAAHIVSEIFDALRLYKVSDINQSDAAWKLHQIESFETPLSTGVAPDMK